MGSFRIVTGSGYGRHEITEIKEVRRAFAELKRLSKESAPPKMAVKKKATTTSSGKKFTNLYDKVWNETVRKANKWARETVAEMRAEVPVDTGNLRDSIHILKEDCYQNKATGEIIMVVGADLDPAGGKGRLYAPPIRKVSPKYGRKTAPWKGYRLMPTPPNEYASKFIGEPHDPAIEERFRAISAKNAKKILGK